jgi:hypothetical protein
MIIMIARFFVVALVVIGGYTLYSVLPKKELSYAESSKQEELYRSPNSSATCQSLNKLKDARRDRLDHLKNSLYFDDARSKLDTAEKEYLSAVSRRLSQGVSVESRNLYDTADIHTLFISPESGNDCYIGGFHGEIKPKQDVIKILKDLPEWPKLPVRIYGTVKELTSSGKSFHILVGKIELPGGLVINSTPAL